MASDTSLVPTLDFDAPVPLHHQLSSRFRTLIASGQLGPGAQLPQVQDICRDCRVSIGTVTRAMQDLKREGLIITRRGRGAYVTDQPAPTTELILSLGYRTTVAPGTFFYRIVDGLRRGLQGRRRYVVTQIDDQAPSEHELMQLCILRRVDSLVVYHPSEDLMAAVRPVMGKVAVVSLFHPIPDSGADCALCDPRPPLREWLRQRLSEGRRRFVYVGSTELFDRPLSAYRAIHDEFRATLEEADVRPTAHVLNASIVEDGDEPFREVARALPDECVIVGATPHVAAAVHSQGRECIAYTESNVSVAEFQDRMTLLYLDFERVGRAAAELIEDRVRGRRAPRTIVLTPAVLTPRSGG